MPSPLIGAATVPATCVPWPSSSTSAGSLQDSSGSSSQGPSISGMSVVKLRLSDAVEVRRDVGMRAVDAGVDDPHAHAVVAALALVGLRRGRVDHPHVPLQVGERLGLRRRRRLRRTRPLPAALSRWAVMRSSANGSRTRVGSPARSRSGGCGRRRRRRGCAPRRRRSGVGRAHGGHADLAVLLDDPAAGALDRGVGGADGGAALVEHDVGALRGCSLGGAGGERDQRGRARRPARGRVCVAWPESYPGPTSRRLATPRARRSRRAARRRAAAPATRAAPAGAGPSRSCPRAPAPACPSPRRSRSRPPAG